MSLRHTIVPAEPLREFVSHYVQQSALVGPHGSTRPVTASTAVLLVFHLQSPLEAFEYHTGRTRTLPLAMVVGPQTGRRAELVARGRSSSLIVRFEPGGFHRLFGIPPASIVDTAVDAGDLIGNQLRDLGQQLMRLQSPDRQPRAIETFLIARIPGAKPRHPSHEAAAAILRSHGAVRVADIVPASGLSARQFERSFRQHMGMSPKLFARAARLEFALQLKRGNPSHTWTRVSQEAGYFDQTHFVKEFKALAGETPSTFPLTERPLERLRVQRPA